ncbi:unnamed protein product [Brugia timori]|uniref:Uncharacterized protein n=1 Tax=Brugia timori TaxID=42155 RepID=A0A3P7WSV5_9BILA|nr:unnamed protein product [Brugia timori]
MALCKTAPTFPLSQYYTSKYCLMFTNVLYSANLLLGFGMFLFEKHVPFKKIVFNLRHTISGSFI